MTNEPKDQTDPPPKRPKPPTKRTKECAQEITGTITVNGATAGTVGVTQYSCSLDTCTAQTFTPDDDGWHFAGIDGASVIFDQWPHFVEWVNAQS